MRFKANGDEIVPEILVSLYGSDSKDSYIASHTYDGSESCPGGRNPACRMEYVPERSGGDPNALFSQAGGGVGRGAGRVAALDVGEDLLDHQRVFDPGDDTQ